jgi:hypothetical protein
MPNNGGPVHLNPQLQNHKVGGDSDLEVAGKDAEYGGQITKA